MICNIYLDCDDVLLDTTRTFYDFMRNVYGIADDVDKYPSDWDITSSPFADFKSAVEAFAHSDYYGNIPPMPQALQGIKSLKQKGYRLYVVSSCPNDEVAVKNRRQCLQRHFGDVFEDVACLSFSLNNKGGYFQNALKGVVIDDSIHNVKTAISCGHKAILMAIDQNKHFQEEAIAKNITVCDDLCRVAEFLIFFNK